MRARRAEFSGGFTFVELMVVLVLFAILTRLVYPSYVEAVRKAKRIEGRAVLSQLMQQQELYFTRHNSYIKFSRTSTESDEKKFVWFSGSAPGKSAYEIKGEPCDNDTIRNCIVLTARAGTENVDASYRDPMCGTLTLNSSGVRKADSADCWK